LIFDCRFPIEEGGFSHASIKSQKSEIENGETGEDFDF
jgi:hypothetical protein